MSIKTVFQQSGQALLGMGKRSYLWFKQSLALIGLVVVGGMLMAMSKPDVRPASGKAHWLALGRSALRGVAQKEKSSKGDKNNQDDKQTTKQATKQKPAASFFANVSIQRHQSFSVQHEQEALVKFIAKRYYVSPHAIQFLVEVSYAAAKKYNLDPNLILAVMAIESRYNPFAESSVGARGLMQVMPKIHRKKFESFGGQRATLDPVANIYVGARILRNYIDQHGTVRRALHRYVGASGPSDGGYGAKVLKEKARLVKAIQKARTRMVQLDKAPSKVANQAS